MKTLIMTGALALALITACTSQPTVISQPSGVSTQPASRSQPVPSSPQPSSPGAHCDSSLWQHVYHPSRLHVVASCVTVTGILEAARREPDGDYHLLLKPDAAYAQMVNSVNIAKQHGDLVLEPVCENPVTQADAVAACAGFKGTVTVPPDGTHVLVTGSYVLDEDHGGWAEIHPVTSITVVP